MDVIRFARAGLIPALLVPSVGGASAAAAQEVPALDGLWKGRLEAPDLPEPLSFELILDVQPDGALRGSLAIAYDHSPVVGRLDRETSSARFTCDFDDDDVFQVELEPAREDGLSGVARLGELVAPLEAHRSSDEPRFHHDAGFPLPAELPHSAAHTELDPELGQRLDAFVLEELGRAHALGVSLAVVADGTVIDVRSFGWEDVARGEPSSSRTLYRWASVAKPLTAVAALQLVEEGRLDLDRDVREYVPEFPDKGEEITPRQLLCHQGGIVHYGNGPVVRTEREVEVEHPSADLVLSLDRFKESPLVARPGTEFAYSSHGYVLLGAALGRAAGRSYAEQVRARIAAPLRMTTLQPDRAWIEVPHRAVGYRGLRIGLGTLDTAEEVDWKLPAGGWMSTIGDLARFAAGLLAGELLEPGTRALMFTPCSLADGRPTGYGLGVGVGSLRGRKAVSHSGTQSKTNTFLLLLPEEGLGVVCMSNTSNFETGPLARRVLGFVLDERGR